MWIAMPSRGNAQKYDVFTCTRSGRKRSSSRATCHKMRSASAMRPRRSRLVAAMSAADGDEFTTRISKASRSALSRTASIQFEIPPVGGGSGLTKSRRRRALTELLPGAAQSRSKRARRHAACASVRGSPRGAAGAETRREHQPCR